MKRSGKIRLIILNLFLLISFMCYQDVYADGDSNRVYTLEESVRDALAKNWTVKAKEEKIEESRFAMKAAKADLYPTFSTTYGYTRLNKVQETEESTITLPGPTVVTIPGRELNSLDNFQWKGTVTQPIFTGFALTSAYELAKLGIDVSELDLALENLDLALQVKEAYFNILGADKAVNVAKSAVESLESHLKVARNFYEVGMIPINDLLKAEVELANAQNNLFKAENASKLARVSFSVLLSRPVDSNVQVEDILVYTPEFLDYDAYLKKALSNRPELKTIDINNRQIDEQIKLAKSKYYPEIAATYSYVKEGDQLDVSGSEFHDSDSWQATVGLSWTFWNWGKTGYSVRQNESRKKQLMQTRKALEDGIKLELRKAILDLQEAEVSIPTAKKAVEQAEENLRVSEERYKAQVTTSTEVLDAQTLLSQARTNYYTALYTHNLAKAGLLRAVGEY